MTVHRSTDGFYTPKRPSIHRRVAPTPPPHPPAPPSRTKKKEKRRLPLNIFALVMLCLVIASTILTHHPFAEMAIILYGIIAIIRRIPSRTTFFLTLITLACIPITHTLGYYELAISFASYTFLLLAFATVCMNRELS